MADALAQAIIAENIRNKWSPFILAHNLTWAGWLAHDLCFGPGTWRFLDRSDNLRGLQEPTVLMLENWRYKRSRSNWNEIEMAIKAVRACVIHIPPKDELPVDDWFEQVVQAFDAARIRPRST